MRTQLILHFTFHSYASLNYFITDESKGSTIIIVCLCKLYVDTCVQVLILFYCFFLCYYCVYIFCVFMFLMVCFFFFTSVNFYVNYCLHLSCLSFSCLPVGTCICIVIVNKVEVRWWPYLPPKVTITITNFLFRQRNLQQFSYYIFLQ